MRLDLILGRNRRLLAAKQKLQNNREAICE